mgnify:CR=1 FL=1
MSIRQGNKVLSAGQSLTQNLFDFKWADHILDDIQWLRADTFTWHDGRVYEAAYQHLLAEWNEVGDVPSTEIIAGTQIYYRLAPDGHKICSASQEDEAVAIYEATGIAWYYILDTTNQRFKLPRTKFGFVGLRDNNVGKYIPESLPNITGTAGGYIPRGYAGYTGVFTSDVSSAGASHVFDPDSGDYNKMKFDASRSSSVYQNNAPVQERSTQMYLYFFVGNFAQSAVVNTAGINATLIEEIQNDKQDVATAVNYKNITNCITEIPQDIKLEISDGTLILKAGSKVYVPNGAGVFNTITTTNDISVSGASTSPGTVRMLYYIGNNAIAVFTANLSGTTPPTSGTNQIFYNTSDNTIKRYNNGSVAASGYSFPLALIKDDGTYLHGSIDQVFNGFGYIGYTVFALPGVKGLIPDGRNADGTLKNIEFATSSVLTIGYNVSYNNYKLALNSNYIGVYVSQPIDRLEYKEQENINYNNYANNIERIACVGYISCNGTQITTLEPKNAFHAVDYNDFSYLKDNVVSYNNITNCITEIPQDIKLELNAGTLTLKAGSKVYVPNGAGVFNVITIASDLTMGPVGSYTGTDFIYVRNDGSMLDHGITPEAISGTTAPTGTGVWYDTTNNLIKLYSGGADTGVRTSFPIAVVHRTSGTWDNIDQVFNGLGYIGSTIYMLPGVKGLIPNGRNADGTLNNLVMNCRSVKTKTLTTSFSAIISIGSGAGLDTYSVQNYNPETNYNYNSTGNLQRLSAGTVKFGSGGVVQFFNPKTTFQAVDYNDTEFITHQPMPSTKYNTLTIGAAGATYTAPADGYFWFGGLYDSASAATSIVMRRTSDRFGVTSGTDGRSVTGGWCAAALPVNKGDTIAIYYYNITSDYALRFYYANGSK